VFKSRRTGPDPPYLREITADRVGSAVPSGGWAGSEIQQFSDGDDQSEVVNGRGIPDNGIFSPEITVCENVTESRDMEQIVLDTTHEPVRA